MDLCPRFKNVMEQKRMFFLKTNYLFVDTYLAIDQSFHGVILHISFTSTSDP